MNTVQQRTYPAPPVDTGEILRYAGSKTADPQLIALLSECLAEAERRLTYQVCFWKLPVTVREDVCDFGVASLRSRDLAAYLSRSSSAVLFAATVGVEFDRLLLRSSRLSPARALLLQAIGAERIEALCNAFCDDIAKSRARFSPGYGDLPLSAQRELFRLLRPEKHIGVTLNDSMLMSPSKSVTAIVRPAGEMREVSYEV